MNLKKTIFILFLTFAFGLSAQTKAVRIYGYIIDEENRGIENAKVQIDNKKTTLTNKNGFYELFYQINDSVKISFSHIGYQTLSYTIKPSKKVVQITTILPYSSHLLKEVNFSGKKRSTSQMESIDPTKYKLMPNSAGSFESLLITFSGVSSNNELSSQYNVRGGNFDENIVYVNGTEIYRPILTRTGQQEGLSFINPDMVGNVKFSSGGFNAEYGDKMSSVLDVTYKKPKQFEASATDQRFVQAQFYRLSNLFNLRYFKQMGS